jgi:hypothetical protein
VGATYIGGGGLDGEVIDQVAVVTAAGADLSFRHDGVGPDTAHVLAVALDGELFAVVPSSAGVDQVVSFPSTVGEGDHRVDIVPVRGEARRVQDLHGAAYGRRAYLRWPESTSDDLDAYLIYSNGGTGTVDYDDAMATVDEVDVHTRWFLEGSGTGTGRVTIGGSCSGERLNQVFAIETDDGTFRHNVSGAWSPWMPIVQGVTRGVDFGVTLRFEDAPSAYAALTFDVVVGPAVSWNSPELPEGSWLFSVKGRDLAGNLSTALTEVGVAIIHLPGAVTDLAVAFDPDEALPVELSWTLPADVDLAAVEIFSNYSLTFERLMDRIIEDAPWVTLVAAATGHALEPPEDGLWRFLVRTRDSSGRRSDTIEGVWVDTTGVPSAIALNEPEQVEVRPGPAGSFVVSWGYLWEDGEDLASFKVYDVTASPTQVGTAAVEGGVFVSYEVAVVGPFASPTTFAVAAVGPGGVELLSEAVEGTPDSSAPSLSEPLLGVAN